MTNYMIKSEIIWKIRAFLKNKTAWLVLMACSMWLDGMSTAYNIAHGRVEQNPLLMLWFDGRPWGFVLSIAITGFILYYLVTHWDDKEYRYVLWGVLIMHILITWVFNFIKVAL